MANEPDLDFIVEDSFIDMNGHMNFANYQAVFKLALDALMERCDLGESYRERSGCSLFIVESRTLYERELRRGAAACVFGGIREIDGKRLNVTCEMRGPDGQRAALFEAVFLNVSGKTRRSVPFASQEAARLQTLLTAKVKPDPEI